jgi:hypothetical protein
MAHVALRAVHALMHVDEDMLAATNAYVACCRSPSVVSGTHEGEAVAFFCAVYETFGPAHQTSSA